MELVGNGLQKGFFAGSKRNENGLYIAGCNKGIVTGCN